MRFECLGKESSRAQKHKTALRDHLLFCSHIPLYSPLYGGVEGEGLVICCLSLPPPPCQSRAVLPRGGCTPHEVAIFRGNGSHFRRRVARLATSQGLLELPAQTICTAFEAAR